MSEWVKNQLEKMSWEELALLDKLGIKIIGIDAGHTMSLDRELTDKSWAGDL